VTDTDPLAAELDKIRQFLDGANDGEWYAAGRMLMAAVDAVLKMAAESRAVLSFPPADCTSACGGGPCNCSGKFRAEAWDLNPDKLRSAILAGLTGEGENGG
jgi:hypothetical protein